MRKTENYAGFISKPGTDELKMKFFVKNSSILNKIRISSFFSDRQLSFSFLYCLHLLLARAHATLENICIHAQDQKKCEREEKKKGIYS